MKSKLRCPKCHHHQLARIARRGVLRERILPLLGIYPWECGMCRQQFLLRRRTGVYGKSSMQRLRDVAPREKAEEWEDSRAS